MVHEATGVAAVFGREMLSTSIVSRSSCPVAVSSASRPRPPAIGTTPVNEHMRGAHAQRQAHEIQTWKANEYTAGKASCRVCRDGGGDGTVPPTRGVRRRWRYRTRRRLRLRRHRRFDRRRGAKRTAHACAARCTVCRDTYARSWRGGLCHTVRSPLRSGRHRTMMRANVLSTLAEGGRF